MASRLLLTLTALGIIAVSVADSALPWMPKEAPPISQAELDLEAAIAARSSALHRPYESMEPKSTIRDQDVFGGKKALGEGMQMDPADATGNYPTHDTNNTYVKIPGVLQFGDVVNMKGENGKYLSSVSGICNAFQVSSNDAEDFGLVNPDLGEDNHDSIKSGDHVSLRATEKGEFITMNEWDDNVAFGFSSTLDGAAKFRIVTNADATNAEESTSEGEYTPGGAPISYGTQVMLFPVTGRTSRNVDKYSLYAQESGHLFYTDSIYMGWHFELSAHNECYKPGDEAEGVTCCNWRPLVQTNNGVAEGEQRLCCRRTGHHLCHATQKRITQCATGYTADDVEEEIAALLATRDTTEAEAKKAADDAATAAVALEEADENRDEAQNHLQALQDGSADSETIASASGSATTLSTLADDALTASNDAQTLANAKRTAADTAETRYVFKAKGGICCKWIDKPDTDITANPRYFDEECCSTDQCYVERSKTAHSECHWNGELTPDGCKCDDEHGGPDCAVQSSNVCFSGTRQNGVVPSGKARCKTCYRCQSGSPTKVNGRVTIAGDDRCVTEEGPETLCLSCYEAEAGLIRFGDTHTDAWSVGYLDTGSCTKYPTPSIGSMSTACKSNCYPRHTAKYAAAQTQVCTKICGVWNPVSVHYDSRYVQAMAFCSVSKATQCVVGHGGSLSNDISVTPRQCYSQKSARATMICYIMQHEGNTVHGDGYGTGCATNSMSAASAGVTGSSLGKWCCYTGVDTAGWTMPSWLQATAANQWCSGPAVEI